MFAQALKKTAAIAKPTTVVSARTGTMQVRRMGGGHSHGPPPTGFEAKVRAVLPHDHQLVMATLGIYTSIFLLFKLKPSKKKAEEPAAAAGTSSGSDAVPSLFDDEFDAWSKVPGNMAKWEASLDTFGK